jgi:FKBP-type peptidyl-prolyl cis-trans isomerase (trigger factor)
MTDQITNSIAREDDGTVQITFTLPVSIIKKAEDKAVSEFAKDITVKGFRKGKAPLDEAKKHIAIEKIVREVITSTLPAELGKAIEEHKVQAMMYPRIEVLSVEEGKDWQVRAVTCELPIFELGNYKEAIKSLGKTLKTEKKELSVEEKQKQVIDLLEKTIAIKIPHVLVEEEVQGRLTTLLERIEKLGLNLESYLASLGKTPEVLRKEYTDQATSTISMELILEKIAREEGVEVKEEQIDEVMKISEADKELSDKLKNPEQRSIIKSILRKRTCLDSLTALL